MEVRSRVYVEDIVIPAAPCTPFFCVRLFFLCNLVWIMSRTCDYFVYFTIIFVVYVNSIRAALIFYFMI